MKDFTKRISLGMDGAAIQSALKEIESTRDLLERGLKLAGLISALFAKRGIELFVVGGAAIRTDFDRLLSSAG
ncbi:MAG TPA: hypothetical protein VLX68_10555 [Chitinivibrionales bacterium]|nr:hypothetical protein [Chitinivibrionales bacterium]